MVLIIFKLSNSIFYVVVAVSLSFEDDCGGDKKMSERDIGLEILEGIKEIKAHKAGETELKTCELKEPSAPKSDGCKSTHNPGLVQGN